MVRPLIVIAGLLMLPCGVSAYDALLLDPDEDRVVSEPDVAIADDGSTVVVWASHVVEGAQPLNGIRVRRFNAAGLAEGDVFRIDVLPGDLARKPSIDMTPDGSRVVVAWEGGTEGKRDKRRIWVQVFDAGGLPLNKEIRVDQTRMTHEQWGLPRGYFRDPKVSIAPNGEFVVVWRTEGRTSCDRFNISARRFDRSGVPLGDEFIVNTDRRWSQVNPDVDHDAAGGFVVVWQSGRWIGTRDEVSTIQARIFQTNGHASGDEIRLSSAAGRPTAALPSVSVAPGGGFVCAWKAGDGDEPLRLITARRFGRGGNTIKPDIVIEPVFPGAGGPEVEVVKGENILVAWRGRSEDFLQSPAVVARLFSPNGEAISDGFPLSPPTCWNVTSAAVAGSARGAGAVVWMRDLGAAAVVRRFSGSAPWMDLPLTGGGLWFSELLSTNRRARAGSEWWAPAHQEADDFIRCLGATNRYGISDYCLPNRTTGFTEARRTECRFALASLAATPEVAVSTLRRKVERKQKDHERAAAACAIGLFGEEGRSAIPTLMQALGDENMLVAGCAGWTLGKLGVREAARPMIGLLLEGHPGLSDHERLRPIGMHNLLITGLAELSSEMGVLWALDRYRKSFGWREAEVDRYGNKSYLAGGLERFVRYTLAGWNIDDPRIVEWTIDDAMVRLEEGWIDAENPGGGSSHTPEYDDIDVLATRYAAVRNLGETETCDGVRALAGGIAELDRLPGWATELYSMLLWEYRESPCISDLFVAAEGMGSKGAPLAEALSGWIRMGRTNRYDALNALVATDPGCDTCVDRLGGLLRSHAQPDAVALIGALIAAGPTAIRTVEPELESLLNDKREEVRRAAERALDLLEFEADVCKKKWMPNDDPDMDPPPPARGEASPPGPVRTLPPGAVPPSMVQTPVPGSGYTGRPKKPD